MRREVQARLHRRDDRLVLCGNPQCNRQLGTIIGRNRIMPDAASFFVRHGRRGVNLGPGWKLTDYGVYVRGNHARKRMARGEEPAHRRAAFHRIRGDEIEYRQPDMCLERFPARVICDCGALNLLETTALDLCPPQGSN